jgi:predicted Zn-dependent protease
MLEVIGVLKNQELFERQLAREEGREPRAYHGVFSTHPDNDRRLQEVVNEAGRLKPGNATRNGRETFLSRLQGLSFGDSEQEGIIRGNRFLHGPLDFALTFPEGWEIENRPDRLLAAPPDRAAQLEVRMEPLAKRISPHKYLEQKGLRNIRNGQSLNVPGFQAYTATAPVSTSVGERTARFIVLYDRDNAYLFTGISKDRNRRRRFDRNFEGVARSYHKLTTQERKLARELKLKLIKAGANTRIADLARTSPIPRHAESQLRLLNDLYPKGEPSPGQTIKTVR